MPWITFAIVLGAILAIVLLLIGEYREHDCLPHKVCAHRVSLPGEGEDANATVDKISAMVHENYAFTFWRQALLVALISTLLVCYLVYGRAPTPIEFIVSVMVITVTAYFAMSWLWAHFFYPNGRAIEEQLRLLKGKVGANVSHV